MSDKKPYVRDKALNEANNERTGEELREDPYKDETKEEKLRNMIDKVIGGPASSKNVSPNTPKGEDL